MDDRSLTDFRPPPDEVDGLVEVQIDGLLQVLASNRNEASAKTVAASDPTLVSHIMITQADLVEGADGYWTVLAVMAQRALAGQTPLAI